MILVNPNTGKSVDVAEAYVDRFTRAGFTEQESEAVGSEKDSAPAPKRRGRPRKSE